MLHMYVSVMFVCIDTNECLDKNAGCAHTCKNTLGSYYCTCNSGYELIANRHDCTGSIYKK